MTTNIELQRIYETNAALVAEVEHLRKENQRLKAQADALARTVMSDQTSHDAIRSAQIAAGEDAVIANLRRMGLA